MDQSPFQEADSHWTGQVIPMFVWNTKLQDLAQEAWSVCSESFMSLPQARNQFP